MLDPDEQQVTTQLLIYLLPACNSDTFHRLLEFLYTVAHHAHDQQTKDGQEVRAKSTKNISLMLVRIYLKVISLKNVSFDSTLLSENQ